MVWCGDMIYDSSRVVLCYVMLVLPSHGRYHQHDLQLQVCLCHPRHEDLRQQRQQVVVLQELWCGYYVVMVIMWWRVRVVIGER